MSKILPLNKSAAFVFSLIFFMVGKRKYGKKRKKDKKEKGWKVSFKQWLRLNSKILQDRRLSNGERNANEKYMLARASGFQEPYSRFDTRKIRRNGAKQIKERKICQKYLGNVLSVLYFAVCLHFLVQTNIKGKIKGQITKSYLKHFQDAKECFLNENTEQKHYGKLWIERKIQWFSKFLVLVSESETFA